MSRPSPPCAPSWDCAVARSLYGGSSRLSLPLAQTIPGSGSHTPPRSGVRVAAREEYLGGLLAIPSPSRGVTRFLDPWCAVVRGGGFVFSADSAGS